MSWYRDTTPLRTDGSMDRSMKRDMWYQDCISGHQLGPGSSMRMEDSKNGYQGKEYIPDLGKSEECGFRDRMADFVFVLGRSPLEWLSG